MNAVGWAGYGFNCDRSQAFFSNSYHSGSLHATQAPITRSKGTPSQKSDATQTASYMVWNSTIATANPLAPVDYNQNRKWGDYGTKWTDQYVSTEKGGSYEGEKLSSRVIDFNNNIPYIFVTLITILNIIKAFNSIVNSLSSSGFCVNDTKYSFASYGYTCQRDQTQFASSNSSGSSTPQTIKSRGTSSWKSDASKTTTGMSWPTQNISNENPLNTTNYVANPKWGNPFTGTGAKWKDGYTNTEKGAVYEGEIYCRNYTFDCNYNLFRMYSNKAF